MFKGFLKILGTIICGAIALIGAGLAFSIWRKPKDNEDE